MKVLSQMPTTTKCGGCMIASIVFNALTNAIFIVSLLLNYEYKSPDFWVVLFAIAIEVYQIANIVICVLARTSHKANSSLNLYLRVSMYVVGFLFIGFLIAILICWVPIIVMCKGDSCPIYHAIFIFLTIIDFGVFSTLTCMFYEAGKTVESLSLYQVQPQLDAPTCSHYHIVPNMQ